MYYMTTENIRKGRKADYGCNEGFDYTLHICCLTCRFIPSNRPVNSSVECYSNCFNICIETH